MTETEQVASEARLASRRLADHYQSFFSHPPRFVGCRLTGEQLRGCYDTLNRAVARLRELKAV